MTMIPGVDATGATSAPPASTGNALNQLDNTQEFLKLLVAQLQNQDPLNPSDPTQFMSEIAQLTSVQSQTTLAAEQQTTAADSMIGLDVTGIGSNGAKIQGVVTSVLLSPSGPPTLMVGSSALSLSSVTEVQQAAAAAASGGTPSTVGTTPSGSTGTTPSGSTGSMSTGA
jgi:flagellar basal-body rod modification protein FlgD